MEELPGQCSYLALGAARIREIKAIISKLEHCEHGGRVFQKLPRHMQRRAVSSNPKRLPRYLREKHMREGGANVKPSQRPRRKYRRRSSNLLQEYNRRQKKFVWLETHIWHAKRFHMKRQWGYALPDSPACRGYRASLRAATKSCLLQDVSYLCCIELEGAKTSLFPGLARVMQPQSLATLMTPQVQAGKQWISFMFFQPERQPYGAVGEVDLLCHPPAHEMKTQAENSKMWMWVHPSAYTQVLETLQEIFQLVKVTTNDCHDAPEIKSTESVVHDDEQENLKKTKEVELQDAPKTDPIMKVSVKNGADDICDVGSENREGIHDEADNAEKKKKSMTPKDVNKMKLQTRNVPFERTPKYVSCDKNLTVTLLKDTLNRFKLIGPKSYAVLFSALHPATVISAAEESHESADSGCKDSVGKWWEQYFHCPERLHSHQQQVAAWKKLASCPQPSPRAVLPLTVRDPRATLPPKKTPLETEDLVDCSKNELHDWPVQSALYDSDLRDLVTQSKEPDATINKLRGQYLVPGSHLHETPQEARLPLLMLSVPPNSSGHGGGWDVIVPAGWGMSVLLPLVFHGGAVGGQQEAENLLLETLAPLPPHLLPDTPAGHHYSAWLAMERRSHFFKRPPASRHNYIKLGVQFPFSPPWRKLLEDWEPGLQNLFVLRDPKITSNLAWLVEPTLKRKLSEDSGNEVNKKAKHKASAEEICPMKAACENNGSEQLASKRNITEESVLEGSTNKELALKGSRIEEGLDMVDRGCLVMVKVVLQHKGTLEPCSMICLPQEEDFTPRDKFVKSSERKQTLEEPRHDDPNHDQRAGLKMEHNKIKARMRRQKRKARLRVIKVADFVSSAESDQSLKDATEEALKQVNSENEVILKKCSSYKEEMENAWLMKASDPLQCCARKVMGYTTHGTFSQTHGRGAGIGWVGLKPLLHLCRKTQERQSGGGGSVQESPPPSRGKLGCLVMVRNPSSLQYHWARLSVVLDHVGSHGT